MRTLHSRLLRYLDEVARCGSIRKASAHLNVAASSINRQILTLEESLGVPIFERLPRKLRLTAAGEIVIAHVRQTLKEMARAEEHIEDLKGLRRGAVSVATMGGVASTFLTRVAVEFKQSHPQVKLTFKRLALNEIMAAVLAGEVDLGLAFGVPEDANVRVFASIECRLGAVVAPNHPLAALPAVKLGDCAAYPLILPDQSITIRRLLDPAFAKAAIAVDPDIETNSIEMMKRFAVLDQGVAFLNLVNIDDERRRGELVFLPIVDQHLKAQSLMLIHRERGSLSVMAGLFAEALRVALVELESLRR